MNTGLVRQNQQLIPAAGEMGHASSPLMPNTRNLGPPLLLGLVVHTYRSPKELDLPGSAGSGEIVKSGIGSPLHSNASSPFRRSSE